MGKIRIKTIGDEELENKQQQEARNRREVKRVDKQETVDAGITSDKPEVKQTDTKVAVQEPEKSEAIQKPVKETKQKSKYAAKKARPKHSAKYLKLREKTDKNKEYKLSEALKLIPQLHSTSFDESVELHINTLATGISGNTILPHGTGKKIRIVIVNQSEDPKGLEDLVKKVEAGVIDFDILLATPDSMPKLAKVARVLGPRGLMPNPKNGTITTTPADTAKKYEGGQINFKTEAKFPLLHATIGKVSFGEEKLKENIESFISALEKSNIKKMTLKLTMSPSLKIDLSSI